MVESEDYREHYGELLEGNDRTLIVKKEKNDEERQIYI